MTAVMHKKDWKVAKAIAQDLLTARTDANELKKVVAYLCWWRSRGNTVNRDRLFAYLDTLSKHGEERSNLTREYYKAIQETCQTHLQDPSIEGDALLQILGWAGRLLQR